ncbi:unnamed protein product, partial [Prorocentrum cordatum]
PYRGLFGLRWPRGRSAQDSRFFSIAMDIGYSCPGIARRSIAEWSPPEVLSWVESFCGPAPRFLEEEMDGEALTLASVEQLMALGLKRGPAIKLRARVEQLAGGGPEGGLPTGSGTPLANSTSLGADDSSVGRRLSSSSLGSDPQSLGRLAHEIGDGPTPVDPRASPGPAGPMAPPCYLVYNVSDWLSQQGGPAAFEPPAPLGAPALGATGLPPLAVGALAGDRPVLGPSGAAAPPPAPCSERPSALAAAAPPCRVGPTAGPGGALAARPAARGSGQRAAPAAGFQARVAFHSEGTRGDVQPLLVLATALSQRGHMCMMFLDRGMCALARTWGLEATEVRPSNIEEQMESEEVKKAGSTGDFLAMACAGKDVRDQAEGAQAEVARAAKEKVSAFQPDVFVQTSSVGWVQEWAAAADVPLVSIWLQPCSLPSESFRPSALFRASLQPGQPTMDLWAKQLQFCLRHALLREQKWLREHAAGETLDEAIAHGRLVSADDVFDQFCNIPDLNQLYICAWSKALFAAPPDWPETENLMIVGSFRLPAAQEAALLEGPGGGFGDQEQRRRCEAFLAAGPAPVYVGWGSMVVGSAAQMCRLAVGALREAGMRGVVVGGWARLSAGLLDDDPALQAYCEREVLFLSAAPHAWLLPQCACAVHHGGMGTVQASVGAGVPTVVTPVWADQWNVAARVAELRLGARTQQTLSKVTPSDLGEKIRECCQDPGRGDAEERAAGLGGHGGRGRRGLGREGSGGAPAGRAGWAVGPKERSAAGGAAGEVRQDRRSLGANAALSMFHLEFASRHPQLRAWVEREDASLLRCAEALRGGRLFVVASRSGLLVRESAGLGSRELGRLGDFSLVELLGPGGADARAGRCRVHLLEGKGPPEGWVSRIGGMVSGKDVLRVVSSVREVGRARLARMGLTFDDLSGGTPENCAAQ